MAWYRNAWHRASWNSSDDYDYEEEDDLDELRQRWQKAPQVTFYTVMSEGAPEFRVRAADVRDKLYVDGVIECDGRAVTASPAGGGVILRARYKEKLYYIVAFPRPNVELYEYRITRPA